MCRYMGAPHRMPRPGGVVTGRILTLREAADHLGRSRDFVTALIADGKVGGVKHRGRWYVPLRDLDAWVAAGCVTPEPGKLVVTHLGWDDAA